MEGRDRIARQMQHPIETPTKRNNTDQGRTYSVRPSLEGEERERRGTERGVPFYVRAS